MFIYDSILKEFTDIYSLKYDTLSTTGIRGFGAITTIKNTPIITIELETCYKFINQEDGVIKRDYIIYNGKQYISVRRGFITSFTYNESSYDSISDTIGEITINGDYVNISDEPPIELMAIRRNHLINDVLS